MKAVHKNIVNCILTKDMIDQFIGSITMSYKVFEPVARAELKNPYARDLTEILEVRVEMSNTKTFVLKFVDEERQRNPLHTGSIHCDINPRRWRGDVLHLLQYIQSRELFSNDTKGRKSDRHDPHVWHRRQDLGRRFLWKRLAHRSAWGHRHCDSDWRNGSSLSKAGYNLHKRASKRFRVSGDPIRHQNTCWEHLRSRAQSLEKDGKDAARTGFHEDQLYLSLERRMRCGIAQCGHCQLGPKFVCKDGPVFKRARKKLHLK